MCYRLRASRRRFIKKDLFRYICLVSSVLCMVSCDPPPEMTATIMGTVDIAPHLRKRVSAYDTLFVYAQRENGHPLLVKRYTHLSFPMGYALTAEDMLARGEEFFGEYDIFARIDRDQEIKTAEKGDLEGAFLKNPVKVGRSRIDIMIEREI